MIPPFEDEFVSYIELAVGTNVRIVLPALYYAASRQPLAHIHATLPILAVAPSVQWDVYRALVVGREQVLLAEQAASLAFLRSDFRRPQCHPYGSQCSGKLTEAVKRILPELGNLEPFYQRCSDKPHEIGRELELCTTCQSTVSNSIIEGKKQLWIQLPELFGLIDWAALRDGDGDDRQSDPRGTDAEDAPGTEE